MLNGALRLTPEVKCLFYYLPVHSLAQQRHWSPGRVPTFCCNTNKLSCLTFSVQGWCSTWKTGWVCTLRASTTAQRDLSSLRHWPSPHESWSTSPLYDQLQGHCRTQYCPPKKIWRGAAEVVKWAERHTAYAGRSEPGSRVLVGQLKETITNLGLFRYQNASNKMVEGTFLYKLHTKQFLL